MTDMSVPKVRAPAGFVPEQAVIFSGSTGDAVPVSAATPLPMTPTMTAAISTALAGTTSASATLGPFTPELGRPIWVTLSGTWTGTAQLLRSADGGATKLGLTVAGAPWASFTANCNEAVAEESDAAASYYLAVGLSSGALTYRVAQ